MREKYVSSIDEKGLLSQSRLYVHLSGDKETAIQTGIDYLRILAPFYLVVSVKLIADGILRGSEMMSSIFGEN